MLIEQTADEWLMAVATIARGDSGHDTHNTWTMRIESLRWQRSSFSRCEEIRARRQSNDEFRWLASSKRARGTMTCFRSARGRSARTAKGRDRLASASWCGRRDRYPQWTDGDVNSARGSIARTSRRNCRPIADTRATLEAKGGCEPQQAAGAATARRAITRGFMTSAWLSAVSYTTDTTNKQQVKDIEARER